MNKFLKLLSVFVISFFFASLISSAEEIYSFNYTGDYQKWVVPSTGVYRIELWGAQGGVVGGNGSYTAGSIYLERGLELYVYVGQSRSNATSSESFNGSFSSAGGLPGGGATDIRLISGAWNDFESLKTRIMVAGSGGSGNGGKSGAGGGLIGKAGGINNPGTQTKGGISYNNMYVNGGFGYGGGGCSGGSGYYGAGGAACANGASGGSSFISGHEGCNAIKESSTKTNIVHTGNSIHYSGHSFFDTIMIDGDGHNWTTSMDKESIGMPNHDGTGTMVGNTGNGYAKITLLNTRIVESIIIDDAEVSDSTDGINEHLYNVYINDKEVNTTIKIDFLKDYDYVTGIGNVTLKANTEHYITALDSEGNLDIIILNVYEKLIPVTIGFKEVEFEFDYKLLNYEFEVNYSDTSLTPEIITPSGVDYEVINANSLKVGNNKVLVKIKQGTKEIVYTFNVVRNKLDKVAQTFSYTGAVQTYVVPSDGYYEIELWGAVGTGAAYGGYTKGSIYLEKDTTLYIYVGQKSSKVGNTTGFNAGTGTSAGYPGGGATDIRLVGGAWNDFNSLKSRIMVAAGGGTANGGTPGAAGGLTGYNGGSNTAKGGTQTVGGKGSSADRNGRFGYSYGGTGGGNGYYAGGGAGFTTGSGGGSSFISGHDGCDAINESSTETNIVHTGTSIHYSGLKFIDTVMIDGKGYSWTNKIGTKTNMPTFDGTGTMVGNNDNGYAKISSLGDLNGNNNLQSIVLTDNDNEPLKDIDGRDITIDFSPTKLDYSFTLQEDETNIIIDALQENNDASVIGIGNFNVPVGTTDYDIVVTASNGEAKIYTISLTRMASAAPFLKGIKINGVMLEDFKENTFEYNITLPYQVGVVYVEGIKNNENQTITGDGVQVLVNNETLVELLVVSEDGQNNKLYRINFTKEKTTLLKDVSFQKLGKTIRFEPNKFIYELEISTLVHDVNLIVNPYYEGVNIEITGNKYIGENSKVITITSSLEGLPDSVYTINLKLLKQEVIEKFDFPYSGREETFIAPISSNYDIELWGAIGTGAAYGSYTKGTIYLEEGTKLYVYVGQKTVKESNAKGFNAGTGDSGGYSGGGATDIRLVDGPWNDFNGLKSRIMVAAGGGSATTGVPGAGGGLIGYNGGGGIKGATQTSGGTGDKLSRKGRFGYAYGGTGGGNGYYAGGGAGFVTGASGGSSFISGHNGSDAIAETSTENNIIHTGNSNHYSGYVFKDTLMIDGKGYEWTTEKGNQSLMPKPNGGYFSNGTGNNTDGYARIKTADMVPNDNYLDTLVIKNGIDTITLNPTFEPWIQEYNIELSKEQTKINVEAIPKDLSASIIGTGEIEVMPGDSTIDIIVTAQDGTTRTYVINVSREADNDPYPLDIDIKRLPNYLCNMNANYCQYNFTKTTTEYNIELPYAIKEVEIVPVLKSKWQTLNYYTEYDFINNSNNTPIESDGIFKLDNEITTIYIEVISEDGSANVVYTYNFKRDIKGNNNLENIIITNPDIAIDDFEPFKYEYYLTLQTGFSFDIEVIPERKENTKVEIQNVVLTNEPYKTNISDIKQGMNNIIITVTAENGDTKTYILHVYKELEKDVLLNTLNVTSGSENLPLTPIFDNRINDYSISVGSEVTSININAVARDISGTIVSGTGIKNLKSGINNFPIEVKSKTLNSEGEYDINIYNLTVYKDMSSNANISNITIDGYTLNPIYNKDTYEYFINLNDGEDSVNVNVVMEDEKATYTVRGNNNLNKAVNEIIVTGIAEDKRTIVYKIYVYKNISDNNNLASLNYRIDEEFLLMPDFDKNKLAYTLNVAGNIRKIEFNATSEDKMAVVAGNGVYYLKTGDNEINIVVTSESGDIKTYTINVIKALDNDITLFGVLNNRGSEVIKNDDVTKNYDYLINVQYAVNSIEIKGIPNSNTSVVSGNGTYNLNLGNNDITLRVTAEDNTYKDYVVRVVRDKSDNIDLSFLYIKEGGLIPNFNETTIYYEVKVPNEIDNLNKLHIEAIPKDKDAQVVINGNDGVLEVGISKEFTVEVTSPNNKHKKVYTINVTRQDISTENLSLENLTTNRGELVPTFNPDILSYEIEVPYDVTDIEIIGNAFSDNVKIEGLGTRYLNVGKNLISVFVIGESGIQRDYQIVVTRKKSNDASLASLVVKGHILNPIFNKDITTYSLNTSKEFLEFTNIKPSEEEATYEIIGNENFITGMNEVKIIVTAPDNETTKEYILNAHKAASNNNNLESLEVEGYILIPVFHKGVTFYVVDVPNNVNSIMIKAKAEDKSAIISGTGLHTISTGENYFDVEVTSEIGTTKTYSILVTRDASDNNYLASLNVSEGYLDKTFDKLVNDYQVVVPNEIEEIEIYGTKEDAGASVTGFGAYKLKVGNNNLEIIVTSESGKTNIYNVNVIREPIKSALLASLNVEDFLLEPEFHKGILEYFINVPNEITSLNLNYVTEDDQAVVTILGNENFNIGMNEVHVNVTRVVTNDEVLENDYIIYVNRQMSTNNYLDTLFLSNGVLSPLFNKEVNNYYAVVPNNIDEIEVFATTEDNTSKITTGVGKHSLDPGLNTIQVKVRSSVGITRVYTINITREESKNNKLRGIMVKNTLNEELVPDITFDPNINTYNYNLTSTLEYAIISVIKDDENQVVVGDGVKSLSKGLNTFDVVVTAQNGDVNTYTLNIDNPLSSNNYLKSLDPSSGALLPDFDKNVMNYTLEVDDISNLSFDAIPEINSSKVQGHEIKPVEEGTSIRVITVTAEDGSAREYIINVTKPTKSEARLESLEIEGYLVEFDPDTYSYNLSVSVSKKELLESEIKAIPKDPEATVNLMGDLTINEGMINIYVIEVIAKDGYTTETYTLNITRDSAEYSLRSNKYEIVRNEEEDYVIGIQPSTIISDFKNNFENNPEDLKVYLETSEISDTELTATALVLKLEKNGYIYDTLRVIVRGDLTKDGKVNITDQVKMINFVGRTTTFDKYQMLAGDLTFDGKVNITDQVKIINYVGRTISDINTKPTN